MRPAGEGDAVEPVQLRGGERLRRGLEHHVARPVGLRGRGAGQHLPFHGQGRFHEALGLGLDVLPGREPERLRVRPGPHAGRAGYARQGRGRETLGQALRNLDDRALAHAVDDEVRLGVQEQRAPHGVRPEIVVHRAAQGGLDPAQHHRQSRERPLEEARVGDAGPVRARARETAGGVGVVLALLAEGGVMGEHGIQRGRPILWTSSGRSQRGWAAMPTRKPCASSQRPRSAAPKAGWST